MRREFTRREEMNVKPRGKRDYSAPLGETLPEEFFVDGLRLEIHGCRRWRT
jgi:hypothetical protein